MNKENESNPKKTKPRRQKYGKRVLEFEEAVECKYPSEIYPLSQAPNNGIAQKLDENQALQEARHSSPLTAVAYLQHPETPSSTSSTFQACADRLGHYDLAEPDILSALDRAATKMIEVAKEQQRGRDIQLELETVKDELKTVNEDLRLARGYGKSVERSRDKALENLSEKMELLRITKLTSKIYEVEYKSVRQELGEAELRLQAIRAENHRFLLEKQKAERLHQREETRTVEAFKMAEWLRGELASERARVAELELKQGVLSL